MSDLQKLTSLVLEFRNERGWKKYHNPKDSAIGLVSEATELLDEFKWKDEKEIDKHLRTKKERVADELSDVLFWVLIMAHDLKIDLPKAFKKKMKKNEKKYPA